MDVGSQQKRDFENFGALLSLWEGAYQYAVCSYVAVKTPEGPRLLFGRILFEASRIGIVEAPFNFETEHIIAGRAIIGATANDIAAAIQGVEAGKMRVADGHNRTSLRRAPTPVSYSILSLNSVSW